MYTMRKGGSQLRNLLAVGAVTVTYYVDVIRIRQRILINVVLFAL